jgi:hypothetical protein
MNRRSNRAAAVGCQPQERSLRTALKRAHHAAKRYLERVGIIPPETLAEHFARSTPEECRDAANAIGVEVIWDRMIDPLI